MRSLITALGLLIVLAVVSAPKTYSAVPLLMNYQGKITDSTGSPINDTLDVTFKIYVDSVTTSSEWVEIHNSVPIELELIELKLGSITPFPADLFNNDELWLGITLGTDPEISPRTQLLTVPYAFNAQGVDGDFLSAPSEIILRGRASIPPEILIEDDVATPSVEDQLRMSNLRVALFADRNATSESAELRSDGLRIGNFDSTKTITFTPDTLKFESVSVDFVATEANFLSTSLDTAVRIDTTGIYLPGTEIRAVEPIASPQKGVSLKSGDIFMFNKYAGTEITIDGADILILSESDLFEYVNISPSGIDLRTPDSPDPLTLPPILTPASDEVSIRLADDISGQLFASVIRSGRLQTYFQPTGSLTEMLPDEFHIMTDSGASTIAVLGNGGSSGGFVNLSGGAGGGTVRITADSLELAGSSGRILVVDGKRIVEPAGGGAGGRTSVTAEVIRLTDDVGTDSVTIHRTVGLVLVLGSSGTKAVYNAAGVQLTGPTARAFAANPDAISLTRPSTNDAWTYNLDDASDLMYCDLDDDAARDIRYQHTPSKALVVESGTELICNGPTSLNTCDVSGAATYASSVNVSGTMTCTGATSLASCDISSTLTCSGTMTCRNSVFMDLNNDATLDILCTATTTPTLTLAVGTNLDCLGPAFFSSPVQVNSDLTVTGIKAFVQDHPEDETKEIVYVALEGNEAGTYTRGSAQLKNGVAEIELPEDFHLVTNLKGLTAQITPRGPVSSMLYVESVTPTKLVVRASNRKDDDLKFDFMINGIRAGYENHQVIREKRSYTSNN